MKRLTFLLLACIAIVFYSCQENGNSVSTNIDSQSKKMMSRAIDSAINSQSLKRMDSIEFLKTKMPPVFAPELKKSLESSVEALFFYVLADKLGKKELDNPEKKEKVNSTFQKLIAPYQSEVKEYEKANSKEYYFGLTLLANPKDTVKIKAIYVFDLDSLSKAYQEIKIKMTKKSIQDFEGVLQLTYGDEESLDKPYSEVLKWPEVKDNVIYNYILTE